MNEFFSIWLKTNHVVAVFVLFFAIVLRREIPHCFKRLHLLLLPIVAVLFPFIQLNVKENHLVYEFSEIIAFMVEPVQKTVLIFNFKHKCL